MVRHHQRPRGERHELPGQQERERVVGEHDQVHAGEKRREERQHAARRLFVPAVAETVQARCGAAEVDDDEEKRAQGIEPEMRAEPRQPDRHCFSVAPREAEVMRTKTATTSAVAVAHNATPIDRCNGRRTMAQRDRRRRSWQSSANALCQQPVQVFMVRF